MSALLIIITNYQLRGHNIENDLHVALSILIHALALVTSVVEDCHRLYNAISLLIYINIEFPGATYSNTVDYLIIVKKMNILSNNVKFSNLNNR